MEKYDDSHLTRVLCVVAHPDDMEYGGSAAVAKWTAAGVQVHYLLLTAGEVGIRDMSPHACGPLRCDEQEEACRIVGAGLTILDYPDGLLEYSIALRKSIATVIRSFQPTAVMTTNFELRTRWGLNHSDHRACGLATIDAMRDADNPWLYPDAGPAWKASQLLVTGVVEPTHYVDVSGEPFEAGVASLAAHRQYLEGLGGEYPSARELFDQFTASTGAEVGVPNALALTVYDL